MSFLGGGGRARRVAASCTAAAVLVAGATVAGASDDAARGAGRAAAGDVVPGDEWTVDPPESHGMDPADLEAARAYAFAEGRNTQGVVVVHEGAIVGEWYAPGEDQDSWAASWSVGKSFTSALVGIALDEGLIPSIDEPMTTWYPEWAGTPREAITLRHVLHMESGLEWDEDYDPAAIAESEIIAMVASQPDQLAYAASRPAEVPPGTRFNYSSGDTMLLSGVLEQATGMPAAEYARQVLLDPIGIDQLDWWQDAEGHTLTYCCVDTPSRDFARFGLLYLNGGAWGAEQVVPASWVQASVTDTAATYPGYGYQWWLSGGGGGIPPYFSARGHDGQYIYVIPDLDLVVVRNGTYTKSVCPSVADPNLVYYYPPDDLVPGQGTAPPDSWSDTQFLGPIVESLTGAPVDATAAAGPSADPAGSGAGAAAGGALDSHTAPTPDPAVCPNVDSVTQPTVAQGPSSTSPTTATPTTARPARTTAATPRFTG